MAGSICDKEWQPAQRGLLSLRRQEGKRLFRTLKQFQYNSPVANSSWASMPASGFPLYDRAKYFVIARPATARKNAMSNDLTDDVVVNSRGSATMGSAQSEPADILGGNFNEQEAIALRNCDVATEPENCFDYAIMATLPSTSEAFNQAGSTASHEQLSDILIPQVLDAEAMPHVSPDDQPCIADYVLRSADPMAGMETLSVLGNPFKAQAPDRLSDADPAIERTHECSTKACSSSTCRMSDGFASKSSSTGDMLPGSDAHQRELDSTDIDASCTTMLIASPVHENFDDYSLSTIKAGPLLGCTEFSPSKVRAVPFGVGDAAAVEALRHINDNGVTCNRNKLILPVEVAMAHDHRQNVCNEEDRHVVGRSLDDMKACIPGPIGMVGSCPQDCSMLPACHEEPLYPLSGSHVKLLQREAAYAAAAMQPVDWGSILNVDVGARPKRRNVRISQDPQTASARRRRERISDRIRVLQRMVPGGMKMDTASVLDEAIHYLKYLKSQVQTLQWLEKSRSSSPTANSTSGSSSPSAYSGSYSSVIQHSGSPTLMQMIK